jgi:uncharacterized repeat protein (TIGR04076 family)
MEAHRAISKNRGADGGSVVLTSETPHTDNPADMELFDLRVTVERIEGRSVCGMQAGDYFELVNSSQLRLPTDRHFCIFALQAVLPLLPAKQRQLPAGDWLERDSLACCPDPDERLVMRIERIGRRRLDSRDLT